MKSFFKYSMNEELEDSSTLKKGDICIYLRNGNLADEIRDFSDMVPKLVKTKMKPEYFNKKCKIVDISLKIWDLFPTYKVKFLHNDRITFCKKEQLELFVENGPKSDRAIKETIFEDTVNKKINWKQINTRAYKAEVPIEKTKSRLRLDLEYVGSEWVLRIYYHKGVEPMGTLTRRMNGVRDLVDKVISIHMKELSDEVNKTKNK